MAVKGGLVMRRKSIKRGGTEWQIPLGVTGGSIGFPALVDIFQSYATTRIVGLPERQPVKKLVSMGSGMCRRDLSTQQSVTVAGDLVPRSLSVLALYGVSPRLGERAIESPGVPYELDLDGWQFCHKRGLLPQT